MRQGPRTWLRGSRMWSGEAGGGPKREGQSTRDAGQGGVMMLLSRAELGMAHPPPSSLSCRTGQDGGHEVRGGLTACLCLVAQVLVDCWWQRDIGDDQRTWWHRGDRKLLHQHPIELPHEVPLLGWRSIRFLSHHRAVGSADANSPSCCLNLCPPDGRLTRRAG